MKKWGFSIFIALSMILLTGCGEQVESLLDKANQLLDQQLENGNNTDSSSEQNGEDNSDIVTDDGFGHGPDADQMTEDVTTVDENDSDAANDEVVMDDGYGHGPDDDQITEDDVANDEEDGVVTDDGFGHGPDENATTTVEALIQRGEYQSIDLPNGYPLPLPPQNWHLVQMIKDPEEGASAWEGVFCFTGIVENEIAHYESLFFNEGFSIISTPIESDLTPDAKHSTTFSYPNLLEGDMNYYIDQYGNPCTTVYFTYN